MKKLIIIIVIISLLLGGAPVSRYKYNGVSLPGMPSEVDTGVYPRLFIVQNKSTELYNLICTKSNVYAVEDYGTVGVNGIVLYPEPNSGRGFSCSASSFAWSVYADLDAALSPSETTILTFTDDKYRFVWTNTDIADNEGVVHYEASEPVPMFDLKAWLTGFALGLAGKPLPLSMEKREPVAYLYNGVQHPDIDSVWVDKVTYPHAVITAIFRDNTVYYLWLISKQTSIYGESGNEVWGVQEGDASCTVYRSKAQGAWEAANLFTDGANTRDDFGGYYISGITPIWTSHDILNADGTLYLAASEPVPVYE